ncbi:hypothetical protein HWI79_989 [Cryptosporidium felis]|nr:hypothetical protein HWI79_989 [Cryptosporidium felis]
MGRKGKKGKKSLPSCDLDIVQKLALPVDEIYSDPEAQEAINYLRFVREEAKTISTCNPNTKQFEFPEASSNSNDDFANFNKLINYRTSSRLATIRSEPNYEKRKSEIINYILQLKENISTLTETLQTEEIVSIDSWESIVSSSEEPNITFGHWNSHNWCNLIEYFADSFRQGTSNDITLDTKTIHWILLALISLHFIDSYNSQISYCMQEIKRYLESNDFPQLDDDNHFRIETIIIIIKHIYRQY